MDSARVEGRFGMGEGVRAAECGFWRIQFPHWQLLYDSLHLFLWHGGN